MSAELAALRATLERGEEPAAGDAVEVVRRAGGELDHVRVTLAEPAAVEDLSRTFGPATYLPRGPSGGRRALFAETSPRDGERATTVLAELDASGRAVAVVLRPDDLR